MKRLLALIVLALIFGSSTHAQLSFDKKNVEVKLIPGYGWQEGSIILSNEGSNTISFDRRLIENGMKSNWDVKFCECIKCFTNEGNIPIAQQLIDEGPFTDIQPGKIHAQKWKVEVRLKSGDVPSKVYFKVEITDKTNNKKDTLIYTTVDATAVVERANEYSISVYPNPVQDELYINAEFENGDNIGNVTLVNMLGHVVKRKVISGSSNIFVNLSDLPSGLFFLIVEKKGEVIMSERFFKN